MGELARIVVIRICSWRLGVLLEEVLEVQGGSRRCRGKPGLQNVGLRGPGESFKSIVLKMKYVLYMWMAGFWMHQVDASGSVG